MNCELYPHQQDAAMRMHNGCILYGGVGCGKSRTALAYTYINELGGSLRINGKGTFTKPTVPKDIYIITTAKKRDSLEWEGEAAYFCLPSSKNNVIIDSWNNIKKYQNVYGAMFIFDEQRVVGKGAWVKAFLKITRKNHWVLLSATPGDSWSDYIPVFIANGYYKNRTEFNSQHVVYKPYLKFPSVDHYIHTKLLKFYAQQILVKIDYKNTSTRHDIDVICQFNKDKYKRIMKDRWDIYEDCPIEEVSRLCSLLRRVSNSDASRVDRFKEIVDRHKKVIVFYNFDYELEIIRHACDSIGIKHTEWNGHKHEEIPNGNKWVYICQYSACSEGWNCITTDTVVFFSQNYSYKIMEQASGRIDRANTPFKDLYYYHLRCGSQIDIAIHRTLLLKQDFNEKIFVKGVVFTKTHVEGDKKAS